VNRGPKHLDIFSRKIIGWEVHDSECSIKASNLAEKLIIQEAITPGTLRIHSDNGTPMRSSPMINLLEELKVMQSFSRPRVSNDNAFSESLFKTVKYRPEYPGNGFKNTAEVNKWMNEFVHWYNFKHKHSCIGYVTPDQKHRQEDILILKKRKQVYEDAKKSNPERFINGIKNFEIVRNVELPNYRIRH
jgi:putative transposase